MYTTNELIERYGMSSRQALLKYVKTHEKEINASGNHAFKNGSGEWNFDDTAVKIIDGLRGYGQINVVQEADTEIINQYKEQIDNLKTTLAMVQQKLIESQKETVNALKENNQLIKERQRLLTASEELEKAKRVTKDMELKFNQKDLELKRKDDDVEEMKKLIQEKDKELEHLKNRGFWNRVFNR